MFPPMGHWSTGSDSSGTLKGLRASCKSREGGSLVTIEMQVDDNKSHSCTCVLGLTPSQATSSQGIF